MRACRHDVVNSSQLVCYCTACGDVFEIFGLRWRQAASIGRGTTSLRHPQPPRKVLMTPSWHSSMPKSFSALIPHVDLCHKLLVLAENL